MTEGTPKDSEKADLSANSGTRAPLSQYLQTDAEQEEGWTVVSSDESENRTERQTNVSVLKQIKRFLSEDASPESSFLSPEAKSASYRVDYPYYDGEMNAEPDAQSDLIINSSSCSFNNPDTWRCCFGKGEENNKELKRLEEKSLLEKGN